MISRQQIDTYGRDGVVYLPDAIGEPWLTRLCDVAEALQEAPQPLQAVNGEALPDSYLWLTFEACADALAALPLAKYAATLMGSRDVRLFYDQIFTKAPGFSTPTPWHQDASHWCLGGEMICSLWLALDNIGVDDGALRYLPGSHRSGTIYRPCFLNGAGRPAVPPDFEQAYTQTIEVRPGDILHPISRTVHASHPNRTNRHSRRAYVTRWLGDDAVYVPRGFEMPLPVKAKLCQGQPLNHPLLLEFKP